MKGLFKLFKKNTKVNKKKVESDVMLGLAVGQNIGGVQTKSLSWKQ